jgi:hypothetical protein
LKRSAGILALFFAVRIPLLIVRQPFFDELYTDWISSMGFGGILHALHSDSGPPLYYFLVFLFGHARLISLIAATLALGALLRDKQYVAACLLAVFPPAVLFAVDGRAYALCALFVTLGVLASDRDRPFRAAAWFVLAAYSHYYGVLFFPLIRRWRAAILYVLFLPGLWLALHQPREAIAWMHHFAYPDALFVRPPWILFIFLAAAAIYALAPQRGERVAEGRVRGVVIPYILSLPIYVPFRFESVVATPLMQWLARGRKPAVIAMGAIFAAWTILGIVEHQRRPIDDYADAALHVRDSRERVVASGYLYLYTALQRPVTAFPPEQAEHPGWRAMPGPGSRVPRGTFLWIGERGAPELDIIRRTRTVQPLYANARALIVRVN